MQTNTTLMTTLATMVIIAFTIWTVTDAEKVSPCCVAVSKSMENITITGYILQKKGLPCIKAVIFQTEMGQFCIDPRQPWVKEKIIEFRRSLKNKMPHKHLTSPPLTTVSAQTEKQQTTVHLSE